MRYLLALVIVTWLGPAEAQTVPSAKQDAEKLMNQYIGFAEEMLTKHGEFFPYGAAMKPSGEIVSVAVHDEVERPSSDTIITSLQNAFVSSAKSGEYKATALFFDARVEVPGSEAVSDAVVVALDHRDNYSVVVFFPYEVSDGRVLFGELFAQQGEDGIFAKAR